MTERISTSQQNIIRYINQADKRFAGNKVENVPEADILVTWVEVSFDSLAKTNAARLRHALTGLKKRIPNCLPTRVRTDADKIALADKNVMLIRVTDLINKTYSFTDNSGDAELDSYVEERKSNSIAEPTSGELYELEPITDSLVYEVVQATEGYLRNEIILEEVPLDSLNERQLLEYAKWFILYGMGYKARTHVKVLTLSKQLYRRLEFCVQKNDGASVISPRLLRTFGFIAPILISHIRFEELEGYNKISTSVWDTDRI